MKKLLLLMALLPMLLLSQNSYIVLEAQYDSYGPTESQFFITNQIGDTVYHHIPTTPGEYLYDTLFINAQQITVTLLDSYGDGWIDSGTNGFFRTWNNCQDTIVEFICNTNNGFATEVMTFNLGSCSPNSPPPPPCVPATVIINLDQYQSETSWEIADSNGNVVAAGSGYGSSPDYGVIIEPVCIPKGPMFFTIYDSYGDGLQGSLWQGNDGSYFVKQCNDTLVYGTDPAFGNDTIHTFASDSCPAIPGCMDPAYVEFFPFASVDDGSCLTLKIFGCIDSTMYNFDISANTMNMIDSCSFKLILHDLVGNGWIGSSLKIYSSGDTTEYIHSGGFTDIYYIPLPAPSLIMAQFFINSQASLTSIECGFTIINPDGDTIISIMPPFIQPLFPYYSLTDCGNTCIEKVYGCTYPTAINYDSLANTDDVSCYYNPGCTNPVYLEYDANYDYDDGSCSVLVVLGCMDSTALNYDPLANTELTGSCIAVVEGCMNSLAFNFNPNANVDDSSCVAVMYGCIDPTQFNYNPSANTDDGSCIPFVYGCTDSIMFNFNPLANADNTTCVPFIYGCTDPSMLNYDPQANTENFSCISFIYGCTNSASFNYDPLANTDNNSCVDVVEGCMDPMAYNYNSNVNVVDSLSCLYSANCITGDSIPYWLNDPCYAWVIDVDDYCCDNEWDEVCQLTYNYCDGNYIGNMPTRKTLIKKLVAITDLLGRDVKEKNNTILLYIYDDGTVDKIIKE